MSLLSVIAQRNRPSGIDSDIAAFGVLSGATDLTASNALAVYIKGQGIWNDCRVLTFKSLQNAGASSTVFGWGGWTSNNATLFNGPAWGTGGVLFDGTDDRASITLTGIKSVSELYVFDRQIPTNGSAADANNFGTVSFGDAGVTGGARYVYTGAGTGALSGETASMGLAATTGDSRRAGTSGITWSAGAVTQIVTRFAASGFAMWKGKTASMLSLTSGTQAFAPSAAGWATDDILQINTLKSNSSWLFPTATRRVVLLLCKAPLTTQQREDLSDLIDNF